MTTTRKPDLTPNGLRRLVADGADEARRLDRLASTGAVSHETAARAGDVIASLSAAVEALAARQAEASP